MARPSLDIAISGAGITGLAAGLALARNGCRVTIHERAPVLAEVGAGIQLSPNASRILRGWGLIDAVAHASCEPECVQMLDGETGGAVSSLPLRAAMVRHGAPYLVLHRSDLHGILAAACHAAGVTIVTGSEITAFGQGDGKAQFSGPAAGDQTCDVLVAADGVNSVLRQQIDAAAKPVADGQTAWRATLPLDDCDELADPASTSVFMGAGRHLVAYRMGARQTVNLVGIAPSTAQSPAAAFSGWRGPARSLILRAENWLNWPLRKVESQNWTQGRMVLTGDAAHAMTPHAAQGGAMAIEDAAVLAKCLAETASVEAALARYAGERKARTARVSVLSDQNRRIYQLSGPLALARNLALKAMPGELALRRLEWLYGWQG